MRTKIRKVRDAALTYAIVRPPEATRRTPITVSCPNSTGSPRDRVSQVNHRSTIGQPIVISAFRGPPSCRIGPWPGSRRTKPCAAIADLSGPPDSTGPPRVAGTCQPDRRASDLRPRVRTAKRQRRTAPVTSQAVPRARSVSVTNLAAIQRLSASHSATRPPPAACTHSAAAANTAVAARPASAR
jgi:hypothetical protein